jgi:hypothetical protein
MATSQVFQTVSFTSLIYNIDDHFQATCEMFFKRWLQYCRNYLLHGVESFLTVDKLYSISRSSWNRVHKSIPLFPVLSKINPVHTTPRRSTSPKSILIISIHSHLSLPSDFLSSDFPTNFLHAFLLFSFVLHALPTLSSST